MYDNEHAEQVASETLPMEQGFQDGMIARALPGWLRKLAAVDEQGSRSSGPTLTAGQLSALLKALATSLECRQRLALDLKGIQDIRSYCGPLLQQALQQRFSLGTDSDGLYLRHHYFSVSRRPVFPAGRLPQQQQGDYDIPLLDAALANFSNDQASGGLPRKDRVVKPDGSTFAAITATAFAASARELDLGQRYQEHLALTLDASGERTASGYSARSSFEGLQASAMLVDACRARSEGLLSADELELVTALCRDGRPGELGGLTVTARQLSAYACTLEQIVVLDITNNVLGFNVTARVLVYIPDDPVSPWNAATDLDAFIRRTLGKRLGTQTYQRFFSRFVRLRDRPKFFAQATGELMDVADWASRDMDQSLLDYPLPLFAHLAQACIDQIKDDAACIAVPVKNIEREIALAEHERLVQSAWMIAGVVGLFVPWLNALLVTSAAWALLKEVFHAIEAWHEGDARASMSHVLGVIRQVVEFGVAAVLTRTAIRAWSPVDHMVTARLEGGSEKLWQFDLKPFQSAPPPLQAVRDSSGLYRLGTRQWIRIESAFYEVGQRTDEQWQIKPVDGHGPLLQHNGAGAWRVWCEQPVEWQPASDLFRRLGGEFSQLSDAEIEAVMAIHALDADHLRGLHVCGKAPEACVVDTVSRVVLMKRIETLIEQLRAGYAVTDTQLLARVRGWAEGETVADTALAEQVWARRHALMQQLYYEQYPTTAATHELQRDFASLHWLAAQELLEAANPDLVYQAADMARRIRCVRVHEALLFDLPQNLDLGRTVVAALEQLPGAAAGPCWRLYDGSSIEPLSRSLGSGPVLDLRFRNGLFELYSEAGSAAMNSSDDLFDLLATELTAPQRAAMVVGEPFASQLRADIAQRVAKQQVVLSEVLGIRSTAGFFVPPQRLDQGRIGYPLCGVRNLLGNGQQGARNLVTELRDLFPGFNEQQIDEWLATLRASQRDPASELASLRQQLGSLQHQLRSWRRTGKLWAWRARREFAKGLVDCWRYLVPSQTSDGSLTYILSTFGSNLDELPALPAQVSFSHVAAIALRRLQLRAVPNDFLQAFTALKTLSVTNCRLRSLPLSHELAPNLEVLDLSGNQIQLDGRATDLLKRCHSLIYLNLSHNPLRRKFSIAEMQNLHALVLADAQLAEVPEGLMQGIRLHTLDLGDNNIRALPFGFYRSHLWLDGRVRLTGNPLLDADNVWHEVADDQVPANLRWLDLVKRGERDCFASDWGNLEGKENARPFFQMLARLTTSADFRRAFLARYLARRVQGMLAYIIDKPALQEELFSHALAEHCQDNATLRFSDLEVRVRIWKAMHDHGQQDREWALLHLGAQIWRMEALDFIASMHAIRAARAEESLEFALAYRLELVEALDLPIDHDDMLNPGVAALTAQDIASAAHQVISQQSTEMLASYLPTRRFWKEYLAQAFDSRLRVPQSMHDELEALIERSAPAEEMRRLQDRMQQRELNIQRQLTREAIGRHLPAMTPVLSISGGPLATR